MARVISNNLHSNLISIVESLMDNAKNEQKAKLAGMFSELDNAEIALGFMD